MSQIFPTTLLSEPKVKYNEKSMISHTMTCSVSPFLSDRSDALSIGDHIVSVNGIRTSGMKHDEVIMLVKNAEEHVTLEVEYQLPDTCT